MPLNLSNPSKCVIVVIILDLFPILHALDLDISPYLIPTPIAVVVRPDSSLILLQGWLDQYDVKLATKVTHVERVKVTLEVPAERISRGHY